MIDTGRDIPVSSSKIQSTPGSSTPANDGLPLRHVIYSRDVMLFEVNFTTGNPRRACTPWSFGSIAIVFGPFQTVNCGFLLLILSSRIVRWKGHAITSRRGPGDGEMANVLKRCVDTLKVNPRIVSFKIE